MPCLCKVAPAKNDVHMEDVHRAGGIMAILGELDRAGLLHTALPTVHSPTMADALADWDIRADQQPEGAGILQGRAGRRADPDRLQPEPPLGRRSIPTARTGVIRIAEHAFSKDGGLAVLYGNIARGRLHREDRRRRRSPS